MTEILAVFRSRAQATDCNMKLRSAGLNTALINTPKEAGVGCGLSVKMSESSVNRAKFIIKHAAYSAFYGFYAMKSLYGRIYITRI